MEPVKIVFICSSLESGKDGVGDYTRRLACAINKSGNEARIIAINDRRLENSTLWEGMQQDEGIETRVLRFASVLPWKERLEKAKPWVNEFDPGWLSLQYVPFGFHLKGLPFSIGKNLAKLTTHQHWHVMFHELSVNRDESLKFKLWSFLQVKIIQSLLNKLKPAVIHTNTALYKYRLAEMGFNASVLPLFSNIGKTATNNKTGFDTIIPSFILHHRNNYIIGTLFGAFDYKRWDMRSLLEKFRQGFHKRRVVIVSIGRMSAGYECWEKLKYEFPQVIFLSLGEQSPEFISYWLNNYTDFGILTTLPELAGKSGSFMAFKEHGIPVVSEKKTPSLQPLNLPIEEGLIEVNTGTKFQLPLKQEPVSQLQFVTGIFMRELRNCQPSSVSSHL